MPRQPIARAWATHDNLYELYVTKGMSFGQIAKQYKTHSNTVRRCAKRLGIDSRTKSEAQKNFLDENGHPMLGRERTEIEKRKISEGVAEHWDGLTETEAQKKREEMSKRAHLKWEWMTDDEKAGSIKKMHQANREKAGQGSKNENMVAQLLSERGFSIVQRTHDFSPGKVFEIDIAIPSEVVAIEWDGAAHFEPIYGDEALQKTMAKDERKNKSLTDFGWSMIRCRDHSTAHSMAFCQRSVDAIIEAINRIKPKEVIRIDMF